MIIIYALIALMVVLILLLIVFVRKVLFTNKTKPVDPIDFRYSERPFVDN